MTTVTDITMEIDDNEILNAGGELDRILLALNMSMRTGPNSGVLLLSYDGRQIKAEC